jgi:hypothetical protein
MQNRYGYFQRANGVYYAVDLDTKRQTSLQTRSEAEATRLIAAKNQSAEVPQLNRAMAKVYASAASPELMERKWQEVMDAYVLKSVPTTRPRVARAFRSDLGGAQPQEGRKFDQSLPASPAKLRVRHALAFRAGDP